MIGTVAIVRIESVTHYTADFIKGVMIVVMTLIPQFVSERREYHGGS